MFTPYLQFLAAAMAGRVNPSQQYVIEYLQAENRVLREHHGGPRLRLSDAECRCLAAAAKRVGRKGLVGTGVTQITAIGARIGRINHARLTSRL